MKTRLLPTIASVCAVFALALALGCSDSDPAPEPTDDSDPTVEETNDSGPEPEDEPATAGSGSPGNEPSDDLAWETLITGDWEIPAGTESYACVRKTITEDIYMIAMESINPPGTHHTFLTHGPASGPDGITTCDFTVNQRNSVFGSGASPTQVELPKGVAMMLPANTQLLLNLHLFNVNNETLKGTSGTRFARVNKGEYEYLGQMVNVRRLDLVIPPQQETTLPGSTTMPADSTIFAVFPHMHQLGTHLKVTAMSSIEGERVLHDAPFDFEEQVYTPVEPIRMKQGDMMTFECTWMNTRDVTVNFGDSSLDEMCAVGTFRYPGVVPPGGGD